MRMSDVSLDEYVEYALHMRAAGRTVVADAIDDLVDTVVAGKLGA
jgi:hypothetical protein